MATDQAARQQKQSRSSFVRNALREHLRRWEVRDLEERDSAGYSKRVQGRGESTRWEAEAAWPAE